MGFLLGFFMEATLGMIGFWFLEVNSLLFVYMLVSFFFSGQMFPPEMMPSFWPALMKAIPLQYLAYFPASIFLHKIAGAELAWGLAVEALWVVFFFAAARVLFHLRRAAIQCVWRMILITTYWRVFVTFARNSLVRDMTFRGNFIIDTISSLAWAVLNVVFYQQIFRFTPSLGQQTGWEKYQFFAFFSTGLIINALVQMLFMTNIDELTDLIRTGELDFLLLKPIDTQFLVSLKRIEWSSAGNFLVGVGFLAYSLAHLAYAAEHRAGRALSGLPGLRHGDLLQPDDRPGRVDGLDGQEPDALRFLVLHHDLFALSDGDLQRVNLGLGRCGFCLHVRDSGVDRDQRARADAGQAIGPGAVAAGGVRAVGGGGSVAASRWLFQRALNSYRSASS